LYHPNYKSVAQEFAGMEYEFGNIEAVIRGIFATNKANSSFKENLANARKSVDEEKHIVKKKFALKVISIDDKNTATTYVQYHQYSLISFIDELFELSKRHSLKKDSRLSLEAFFFYDQLEGILNFIRERFPEHFSENVKIPDSQKERLICEISRKLTFIKANLKSEKIDRILVSVCLRPIMKLLNNEEKEVTYKKVAFNEMLINELRRTIDSNCGKISINEAIRELLLSLDYNDESYFRYYIDFIKINLCQAMTTSSKLEELARHFKLINQSLSRQDFSYDLKSRSIREQLSDWISNEINFLETQQKLVKLKPRVEEDFVKEEFKIKVAMSVSQFACLIRVFTESGIIENKNVSELIRFLSKFVETKYSEQISTESFRIKYYNLESSTKLAVKNLFHTAISYINSN